MTLSRFQTLPISPPAHYQPRSPAAPNVIENARRSAVTSYEHRNAILGVQTYPQRYGQEGNLSANWYFAETTWVDVARFYLPESAVSATSAQRQCYIDATYRILQPGQARVFHRVVTGQVNGGVTVVVAASPVVEDVVEAGAPYNVMNTLEPTVMFLPSVDYVVTRVDPAALIDEFMVVQAYALQETTTSDTLAAIYMPDRYVLMRDG